VFQGRKGLGALKRACLPLELDLENDACRNSCQTPGQGGVYFFSCFAASIMAFKVGISFISGAELLNVRI
jgi:hypothetical protein